MLKIRIILFCALIFVLCGNAPAQRRKSLQLLNESTGWAVIGRQLFFTTDTGNQWRDITPSTPDRKTVASVYFLNSATGWVLLSGASARPDTDQFDLASTTDAGASWSISRVNVPNLNTKISTLSGDGQIDFVDPLHGWMNLGVVSSSNFSLGAMLQTSDGGKTWVWSSDSPGVSGSILFLNTEQGWLAGGPGGEKLYATRDGAKSWQELSLNAPPEAAPSMYPVYDLPSFKDSKHGSIPVTYSGPEGSGLALVLFTTNDGGITWKTGRAISRLPEIYGGVPMPSAVIDSSFLVTAMTEHTRIRLKTQAPVGESEGLSSTVVPEGSSIDELSFANSSRGWAKTDGKILLTTDGGASWIDVTPPRTGEPAKNSENRSDNLTANQTGASTVATASRGDSIHLGFDACAAPSQSNMATWWTSSPFFDSGVYIGGNSRGCTNPNLTSSWVTQIQSQGWGIMPLWAGPQAPCACRPGMSPCTPFPHVFSNNVTTAQSQGVTQANSAASAASALGLSDTVIYYDMEQYDSSQCGAAVKAFVSGWVNQLHTNGYGTGVYGAPADAQTDWYLASYPPDNVWIAKTFSNSLSSPSVTSWGLSPLVDSRWGTTPGTRIHQYLENHSVKWGTVTLAIDHDFEDAEIVAGNGDKSHTFNYTNIDFPGAARTDAYGIANISQSGQIGTIVGSYQLTTFANSHGFIRSAGGTFSTLDYPGALKTVLHGINDLGQIVGWYADQSGNGHGFLDNAGTFTTIDYPGGTNTIAEGINDAGQITGIYRDAGGLNGFLYYGGTYYQIVYPGGQDVTYSYGINGAGQIAGLSAVNSVLYAFIGSTGPLNWANYGFFIIDLSAYPGVSNLSFSGITNNEQVAGWVLDNTGFHGFLYHNNTFDQVVYPVSGYTFPYGANDAAQIVGDYNDSAGNYHGFLATPQ